MQAAGGTDRDGAFALALENAGVPEEDAHNVKVERDREHDISIWQESDDGRIRFEGELYWNGIKYEFELDAQTGIIFDWNADMREER